MLMLMLMFSEDIVDTSISVRRSQGALTSVLESRVLCFLAAILNFFNTRAQSASARSGTEILEVWDSQILGGSDRSPEIIK